MTCHLRPWYLFSLLLVLLLGCSQTDEYSKNQTYFFLESLKQVETGGRQLQGQLDETKLTEALSLLDQGLEFAFQVERKFLDEFDLRLGKNYQRYFIEGVENYRIGIEAGDQAQQMEGLRLLRQWAAFWNEVGAGVRDKLPSS